MLTVAEVSERIRLHPKTVRRLIRDGQIAASKVGDGRWSGKWVITEEEVDRYLQRPEAKTA